MGSEPPFELLMAAQGADNGMIQGRRFALLVGICLRSLLCSARRLRPAHTGHDDGMAHLRCRLDSGHALRLKHRTKAVPGEWFVSEG